MKHREYPPRRGGHITKFEKEIMKTIMGANNKRRDVAPDGVVITSKLVDITSSGGTKRVWEVAVTYSNGFTQTWIKPSNTGIMYWE